MRNFKCEKGSVSYSKDGILHRVSMDQSPLSNKHPRIDLEFNNFREVHLLFIYVFVK